MVDACVPINTLYTKGRFEKHSSILFEIYKLHDGNKDHLCDEICHVNDLISGVNFGI